MMYLSSVVVVLATVIALSVASLSKDYITKSDTKATHEILARGKRSIGVDENLKKEVEIKTKSGTSVKISKNLSYNDGGALTLLPTLLDSIAINHNRIVEQLQLHKHSIQSSSGHADVGAVGGIGAGVGSVDEIGINGAGGNVGVSAAVVGGSSVSTAGQIGGQIGTNGQVGTNGQIVIGGHVDNGGQVSGYQGLIHNGLSRLQGLKELIQYRHSQMKKKLHSGLHGQANAVGHHGILAGHGGHGLTGVHGTHGRLKTLLAAKEALLLKKLSNKLMSFSANEPIGAPCCPTGPCCPGSQG